MRFCLILIFPFSVRKRKFTYQIQRRVRNPIRNLTFKHGRSKYFDVMSDQRSYKVNLRLTVKLILFFVLVKEITREVIFNKYVD